MPGKQPRTPYTAAFYDAIRDGTTRSAAIVVPLVLDFVHPRSMVDVGCGTAAWAAQFLNAGVDAIGIDGAHIDPEQLQIPQEMFVPGELEQPISIGRRFDLAVCLEVAEHLTPARAPGLVKDLTRLSDCVLFSAAVPGQRGTNHINEQHLSYWCQHFRRHGYNSADLIRPRIWDNARVEWWYRQNIVFFAAAKHPIWKLDPPAARDMIHPELHRLMLMVLTARLDRP
jgi:SAM-dependent methyltransferase